ncbi:hypothetical protein J729_4039, partial [Acinetobacter baumannii 929679-598]
MSLISFPISCVLKPLTSQRLELNDSRPYRSTSNSLICVLTISVLCTEAKEPLIFTSIGFST